MKVTFLFFLMISFTVVANLALKTGSSLINTSENVFLLAKFFNLYIITGLFFFALSAVLYITILRWLPLNLAQSFASAQFIAVILASWLFLGESISLTQWTGIILTTLGILIIGLAKNC